MWTQSPPVANYPSGEKDVGDKCPVGLTALDPNGDGHYYYQCVSNLAGGGQWIHRQCAPGTLFNYITGNCGRYDADFVPVKPNSTSDIPSHYGPYAGESQKSAKEFSTHIWHFA